MRKPEPTVTAATAQTAVISRTALQSVSEQLQQLSRLITKRDPQAPQRLKALAISLEEAAGSALQPSTGKTAIAEPVNLDVRALYGLAFLLRHAAVRCNYGSLTAFDEPAEVVATGVMLTLQRLLREGGRLEEFDL